jgi:hypothetical protein
MFWIQLNSMTESHRSARKSGHDHHPFEGSVSEDFLDKLQAEISGSLQSGND